MRLTPRFLLSAAAPFAALPGQAVAEGMPQLHFGDPLLQGQVVWGALIFLVFYFVLSSSALPRVASVLKMRDERIRNDLEVARKARQDADKAHQEFCTARDQTAEAARANIQGMRDAVRETIRLQTEETAARLDNEIGAAEAQIALSRNNALSHIGEIATNAATALTDRLIGSVDQQVIAVAVERAHAAGDEHVL